MTATAHALRPTCTLLSPGHASDLLAQLVYEQVRAAIDLPALCRIEERLACALSTIAGIDANETFDIATALVSRALHALADNPDNRYDDVIIDECARVEARVRPTTDPP